MSHLRGAIPGDTFKSRRIGTVHLTGIRLSLSVSDDRLQPTSSYEANHFDDIGDSGGLKSVKAILEIVELNVHRVKFSVNEVKEIKGVAKAESERIDQRRKTKRPTQILYVGRDDGLYIFDGPSRFVVVAEAD